MLEHEGSGAPPAKGAKGEWKHNKILIGVGILGVLVAFLTYRRMAASQASSASAGPLNVGATPNAGSGPVDVSGIEGQIATLSQQRGSDLADQAAQNASFFSTLQSSLADLSGQIAGIKGQQVTTGDTALKNLQGENAAIPNLPQQVIDAMKKNGENITDVVKEGTGALYLTNKGGVYAVGQGGATSGAGVPQLFGDQSYLGYAAKTANPGAELAAHGDFSHGKLTVSQSGHYTETNNLGENYTF